MLDSNISQVLWSSHLLVVGVLAPTGDSPLPPALKKRERPAAADPWWLLGQWLPATTCKVRMRRDTARVSEQYKEVARPPREPNTPLIKEYTLNHNIKVTII